MKRNTITINIVVDQGDPILSKLFTLAMENKFKLIDFDNTNLYP